MGNLGIIITFFSVFFISLFHSVFLYPTKDEFLKKCPPIRCGKFGNISFPFTNKEDDPECGPFVVECDSSEEPKMKLRDEHEPNKWYKIVNISRTDGLWYNITITDIILRNHLNTRKCESFPSLSPGLSQLDDYEIIPKPIILFKCNTPPAGIDFEFKYTCSSHDNFHFYYNKTLPPYGPYPPAPPNCSTVELPTKKNEHNKASQNGLFELLSPTFSLQQIKPDLLCHICQLKQLTCRPNFIGIPKCFDRNNTEIEINPPTKKGFFLKETKKESKSKSKWKLALGVGSAAIFMVGLIVMFFIWLHRYKKTDAPLSFRRARTDSVSFSNSDLEKSNIFFGVSIFPYVDLLEATNNFAPQNTLGDGGFGTVYYGILKDGREVAVKHLYERNYSKVKQFLNEIELLTHLRHKNLVSLYGCTSRRSRELLLVYEYVCNGTVADHLHGDRAISGLLTWPIRIRIAIETASALVYLHASGIVHRDVKTNNILLDSNFCVKVADFGISRLFPSDVTHISTAPQGTPGYVDPEYHQCYQLTDKSDVYSFGVVLVELISSMPAVDITRHRHEINLASLAINKIHTCALDELIDPILGHRLDEEVKRMTTSVAELAFLCLQQDKELRPAMDQVLEELKRIENPEMLQNTEGV